MSVDSLAFAALTLAAIPTLLFIINLFIYRPLPPQVARPQAISVLIPARNEEQNIEATLRSVLANKGCDFEVIVLNDHSTDRTADIVALIGSRDGRVQLREAPPLPAGWCGKQHACYVLAGLARHSTLLFLDADVRLEPDALRRIGDAGSKTALASGVPRQELVTFSERLLIPLIHFVLLGFLPMVGMRWTRRPAFSAGCGQIFVAQKQAYFACGGHSQIRSSLHDGVKLPRVFRKAGFKTDLFDATDLATCRMYRTNRETWSGLAKNATEGLAAPAALVPMSILLFGGQILPALLIATPGLSSNAMVAACFALIMNLTIRALAAVRFQQPWIGAVLHPFAVFGLLAIQWVSVLKQAFGKPAQWKGRAYILQRVSSLLIMANLASAAELPAKIDLEDQFGTRHTLNLKEDRMIVLTIADQKGSSQVDAWVGRLKTRFGNKIILQGIADIGGAPGFLRSRIRNRVKETRKQPVLLDWTGQVSKQLEAKTGVVNVFLISNGVVQRHVTGEMNVERWSQLEKDIENKLASKSSH